MINPFVYLQAGGFVLTFICFCTLSEIIVLYFYRDGNSIDDGCRDC